MLPLRRLLLLSSALALAACSAAAVPLPAQAPAPPVAAPPPSAFADAPGALDSMRHALDSAVFAGLRLQRLRDSLAQVRALEWLRWQRDSLQRERQLLHLGGRTTPWMALASPARPHAAHGMDRALLASLPLVAYAVGTRDHDAGGYPDDLRPRPDKVAHGSVSVILARLTADATGSPLWGAGACALAGAAFELGQARDHGYASRYDLAWDAGGCVAGALWHALASRAS